MLEFLGPVPQAVISTKPRSSRTYLEIANVAASGCEVKCLFGGGALALFR